MHDCLLCEGEEGNNLNFGSRLLCLPQRWFKWFKPLSFKDWAIHAGVAHQLIKKVMEEEAQRNPSMKEVLAKLTKVYRAEVVKKRRKQKWPKTRVGRPERQDDDYIPSVPKTTLVLQSIKLSC